MSPARQGAFNANFDPDTLNRFRDLCRQQGKQYTKVLERLAERYLETDGEVLKSALPVVTHTHPETVATIPDIGKLLNDLLGRVEQLESDYRIADEHLEGLLEAITERVEALEN